METNGHALYHLHDFQLLDVNDCPVGTVDWIWTEDGCGSAAFIGVHLQWWRGRARAVPAQGACLDVQGRTMRVTYPRAHIRSAPRFAIDHPLRPTDQQAVVAHFACRTGTATNGHPSLRDLRGHS